MWRLCAPGLCLALTGGCLAGLERAVDLVLAPTAFENALVLPFSALGPLAFALFRLR
jgi:hypothetical protein